MEMTMTVAEDDLRRFVVALVLIVLSFTTECGIDQWNAGRRINFPVRTLDGADRI